MSDKSKKIIVKVTPQMHMAVKIKAAKVDTSVSEVIRGMLETWLAEKPSVEVNLVQCPNCKTLYEVEEGKCPKCEEPAP